MSDQDDLLLRKAKEIFLDNLHVSEGDWEQSGDVMTLTCKDCKKCIQANIITFELKGEAMARLCPEPPPRR